MAPGSDPDSECRFWLLHAFHWTGQPRGRAKGQVSALRVKSRLGLGLGLGLGPGLTSGAVVVTLVLVKAAGLC